MTGEHRKRHIMRLHKPLAVSDRLNPLFGDHVSLRLGVVHNCHHFHERTQRTLGGGGQGRSYAFLNVVYSDGNEIIAYVRRTSMTKNPLVRNSLLVQKL